MEASGLDKLEATWRSVNVYPVLTKSSMLHIHTQTDHCHKVVRCPRRRGGGYLCKSASCPTRAWIRPLEADRIMLILLLEIECLAWKFNWVHQCLSHQTLQQDLYTVCVLHSFIVLMLWALGLFQKLSSQGGPHFFSDPSTPRTHKESEPPPTPRTRKCFN